MNAPGAAPGLAAAAGQRTGYLSQDYAGSLSEFGQPLHLPRAGAWLLVRGIAPAGNPRDDGDARGHGAAGDAHDAGGVRDACDLRDAMGCYPLLACERWEALAEDLSALGTRLVSVTAVSDPFADCDAATVQAAFPDLVRPFKRHFVCELGGDLDAMISPHHRRCARKAARKVDGEVLGRPLDHLAEWLELFEPFARARGVGGIRAFSSAAFERQLAVPGVFAVRAVRGSCTVGMQIWMLHGRVAYGHALALSDEGYRLGAGYALYRFALEQLAARVDFCDLGAVPGCDDAAAAGLAAFKAGWSNARRTAYLCGRISNPAAYARLAAGAAGGYFPAYRRGELAPPAP